MTSHAPLGRVSTQQSESFPTRPRGQERVYDIGHPVGCKVTASQPICSPQMGFVWPTQSFFLSFFFNYCQHLKIRFHILKIQNFCFS
jgi:hypothetical protein